MSAIARFLQSLSDRELAFLFAYKYAGYMDRSQRVVDEELNKRGLDALRREAIMAEPFPLAPRACRRCGSSKHLDTQVEKWNTNQYSGLDRFVGRSETTTREECAVCGLLLYNGNEPVSGWSQVLMALLSIFTRGRFR